MASDFYSLTDIRNHPNLKIGVFDDPVIRPIAQLNFAPASIVQMPDYSSLPENVDAALWTRSHTDAWVTVHPGFTSLTPQGLIKGWPLEMAFLFNKDANDFVSFVNYWLQLQKTEGFFQEQYTYWVDRVILKNNQPRWSILQNVLEK
jgi:hypothetical protein